TCPTCPPSSSAATGGVLGAAPPGGASSQPACLPPTSQRPCIDAPVAVSRVALRAIARSGRLSTECNDVLCRIATAIVRLEGRESEVGRERLALYLGSERGIAFRAFSNLPS
ncbi:hypothetical protein BHE74_00030035, partial [Ensete ventricosum]